LVVNEIVWNDGPEKKNVQDTLYTKLLTSYQDVKSGLTDVTYTHRLLHHLVLNPLAWTWALGNALINPYPTTIDIVGETVLLTFVRAIDATVVSSEELEKPTHRSGS
jgi:hypothetical protein